jgi:hypothetical protein
MRLSQICIFANFSISLFICCYYNTSIEYASENKNQQTVRLVSLDSAVGIATSYGLDERGVGVRVPVVSRIVSSPRRPGRLCGPPTLLSNGYLGLFPRGVKRQGRKADHSPPVSVEVKKTWIYTSTPPYVFMA